MRIKKLWVRNFRAIEEIEVEFNACNAILGENNSGKSACMSALDLFFNSTPRVSADDFTHRDVSKDIEIAIEFSDLTPSEHDLFGGNLIDGALRIARTLSIMDPKLSGRYFVAAYVNADFSDCRLIDKAKPKRDAYDELRNTYTDLPKVSAADQIEAELEKWESVNEDSLTLEYVAGFRGFQNVAVGQLREKTDLVYVPAVKDAADAIQNEKSSPVKQLLNTIARQTIENSEDFRNFKEGADETLKNLTSPENVPQLEEISTQLTSILARYYSGSSLNASWEPITELPVSYPKSDISVTDNGFVAPIENVGHGLQRAILFTVLEYMAQDRAKAVEAGIEQEHVEPQSDIILLIEEPEIFQHPIKQRLFREAFKSISDGFNTSTGIRVQIVYTTHSPLLVDIRDFDSIGVLRRDTNNDESNVCIAQASLSQCAKIAANAKGLEVDEKLYQKSLHIFTPEIAEGFFAKKVVLVEGAGDLAVLQGFYKQRGRDPLADGIHVVQANGKTNFDKPRAIFDVLSIPVFCIFDNDLHENNDGEKEYNIFLQVLCGESNIQDWPEGCFVNYAAFNGKLEKYVASCVGQPYFDAKSAQIATLNGVKTSEALKNPTVASILFGLFLNDGHSFDLLDEIVKAVDDL